MVLSANSLFTRGNTTSLQGYILSPGEPSGLKSIPALITLLCKSNSLLTF
jgi:hypothetical protein